jgi:hypothetical protein
MIFGNKTLCYIFSIKNSIILGLIFHAKTCNLLYTLQLRNSREFFNYVLQRIMKSLM